jgi:hypothetical protein
MSDDGEMGEDRLWLEAVKAYNSHHTSRDPGAPQPDRAASRIFTGPEATVTLRSAAGLPLGTVSWYGQTSAAFEPPTRVTVVDHFQGLRPKKP